MQDIYINDVGKGIPIVLVHGFLGSSIMWKPQINFLKKNYRVITIDLPGFGKSKKIKSQDSIIEMAKIILRRLGYLRVNRFNLLGHSMGGMIVQEMVKLASDKIIKLICYGTGPIGNIPGRFETINESRKRLREKGLKVTAYRIAKTWFVKGDKSNFFYLCEKAFKDTSFEAADNALIAMENWNGLDNLKNIVNSTLIIWGDQDKAYNFNQVNTLNTKIPNSKIEIFKDCSHNVHLEMPDLFNKKIIKFLEKKIK